MGHKYASYPARLVACAGLLALLAGQPAPAQAWEAKTYDNLFVVDFPDEPQQSQQKVQTPAGPMVVRTISVVTGEGVYAVQYYELPAKLVDRMGTDRFLDKARDDTVGRVNGRLVTEAVTTLEGFPGRAFLAVFPDQQTHLAARTYLAGNRAYVVLASGSIEALAQPACRRFFNSFGLLNRATPRDAPPNDDDYLATPEE